MYYEEKIINGVFCFRNSPKGTFSQMSPRQLTDKFLNFKSESDESKRSLVNSQIKIMEEKDFAYKYIFKCVENGSIPKLEDLNL